MVAGPAGAQPLAGEGPSPGSAALRSLILPGWGQAANGRWLKAGLAFGAYGGLMAWGVALNQDKQDAVGFANEALFPENETFWEQEAERLDDARNAKFWFAGLTLLLSMADALVDAHLQGFDERIDAEVGRLSPAVDSGVGLVLTARWGEAPARRGN